MYNTDYAKTTDEFRRDVFGYSCLDHADALRRPLDHADALRRSDEARRQPAPKMKTILCVEDTNGEWVPITSFRKS